MTDLGISERSESDLLRFINIYRMQITLKPLEAPHRESFAVGE